MRFRRLRQAGGVSATILNLSASELIPSGGAPAYCNGVTSHVPNP